eukprot:905287-Pleurochrysis_carterae.AAC.1
MPFQSSRFSIVGGVVEAYRRAERAKADQTGPGVPRTYVWTLQSARVLLNLPNPLFSSPPTCAS